VIDGGSQDGTVDVLRSMSKTTPNLIWTSERDAGQSDALNKALALVDTQYFGWLNADDCYLPGRIGTLLQQTKVTPVPSIVYGDYQIIDKAGRLIKRRPQPSFNYSDCLYSYLTIQNCAAIFHTERCRSTGGFDRSLDFCMDYDLVLRMASDGPVRHVREYTGCFRHHEDAKTARLQRVCELETRNLRIKYSGRSARELQWRYWLGTVRVAGRMIAQGCIGARLFNTGSTEIVES
jgi:GT2 family glycosyltransferase